MNSLKKISAFALLFLAFGMSSCSDVEPLDPAVVVNPNPSNPSNPSNPGISTGDYWPTALNNSWTFKDDGVVQPAIKIVSINSIGSDTYYTFNQAIGSTGGLLGNATTRLKKAGGTYYYKVENIVIEPVGDAPGITISGFETVLLKDNISVGATWTGNYTQTISFTGAQLPSTSTNISYVGSIVEKNATIEILGETFTNVIKVKMVQTSVDESATSIQTSFYWFAKDVGPIKYTIEDEDELSNADLVEYTLN